VVARINDELCVKRYCVENGLIYLVPENELFQPILITEEMDFEIWGRVIYSIQPH
jgi:SOS-response transcriptional repressor LexA